MATPLAFTTEGFEAQFGTNYVGHVLLTKLLLPILLKTAELSNSDVRIVNVSSIGHYMAPRGGIIFDPKTAMSQSSFQQYGQSKLANILHSKGLVKRYPQLTSVSVHPGLILTDLYVAKDKSNSIVRFLMTYVAPLFFGDAKQGALNQLWAATAPKSQLTKGGYYMPVGRKTGGSCYARDEGLADRLWDWTEDQIKNHWD